MLNRVSARTEVGDELVISTKQLGVEDLTKLATMQKEFSEGAILAYEQGHLMISCAQDGNNT